jgi:hypothetical protein
MARNTRAEFPQPPNGCMLNYRAGAAHRTMIGLQQTLCEETMSTQVEGI